MSLSKSALIAVASMALVIAGYWLSGWDFNERGQKALECFLMALVVGAFMGGMAAAYPGEGQ